MKYQAKTRVESEQRPRTEEEISLLQKIWALMVEYGMVIHPDLERSYYGSYIYSFYKDDRNKVVEEITLAKQSLKTKKVNWQVTEPPELFNYSEFAGTDQPCNNVDIWEGALTMVDGSKVFIYCNDRSLNDIKPLIREFLYNTKKTDVEDLVKKHFLA